MEFIKQSAKAIVAFIVTMALAWLAKKGLKVDADTSVALTSALTGLVVAVVVWLVPNKPKQ